MLDEQVDYILQFDGTPGQRVLSHVLEAGGEWISDSLLLLRFKNFVGTTRLGDLRVIVQSRKIPADGVSLLLTEVSSIASNLLFAWNSPTGFSGSSASGRLAPVPFHQIQLLRRVMLEEKAGDRFQDWLEAIDRNPVRRFEQERPVVPLYSVKKLDGTAIRSAFAHVDRLVPVDALSSMGQTRLAQALSFGSPRGPHMPGKVAVPRSRLSHDAPENRFVKHVLTEATRLAHRFAKHPLIHPSLRMDCATMTAILETFSTRPFIAEAGPLTSAVPPSQVLLKAEGYRDIYGFWERLSRHVSFPASRSEVEELLQGRDIATLYEYWVWMQVLKATVEITEATEISPPEVHRTELGESLRLGIRTKLGTGISVEYNPTFTRSAGTAYSTPLRPDVVLTAGQSRYAFDAKYRLDAMDVADEDSDDGGATYKQADLYKMHTYRDAIRGLAGAFVVYPGTEFVFFERSGLVRRTPEAIELNDGVGAVPLRPNAADAAVPLRGVIRTLLIKDPVA